MMMPGMTMNPPMPAATGMNMMVIPRCTMKMEKCDGGMKMTCVCEDAMSVGMLHNLCTMLSGSMVNCYTRTIWGVRHTALNTY